MNAPAPKSTRLPPETMVDGFRVRRLLGEGAMGEVYLAVDEQLGRKVALKLIKGLDPSNLTRFLDEARTTAQFNHPHIVTVYAVGQFQAQPYLALEYLDGQSLRARLTEGGPLPSREVMRIGRGIAEALAEAHARGVIHADLKPDNIVIPRDGRARVVDFGLARLVGQSETATSGTPGYMAPERWAAATPQPAIDVWALAFVLCEAIDGQPPLSERDIVALAYSPKDITPGPVTQQSACAALLTRCLAVKPEERPTAAELARELDLLLAGRVADETRSPFRGLEAFTEADAQDFHGREAETDAVVERLRTEPLVPIIGPSGVGKSSFINAGLTPRLRELGPHLIVTVRPGRRPLSTLVNALGQHGSASLRALLTTLSTQPGALRLALRQLADEKSSRVVLVIDQFEEVLTLSEPAERDALLAALATTPLADEPCRVLLSFRSDFLGKFAATALEAAMSAFTVLRPLSKQAIERAIVAPLQRVGYRVDLPDLPQRIATELDARDAALPLLQFAMDALWRRRDSGRRLLLTPEYEAMGGALGALAKHAERVAADLTVEQRAHTRALMLELVNVDGTRRPRTREELLERVGADAAPALDGLVQHRLLSSGISEETGAALVELAHESLTSTWPALARWLAETQEARSFSHELEQAAKLWDSRGQRADETWLAEALRDARRRAQAWKVVLSPLQERFLAAGETRQRELDRRARRRRVLTVATLSLVALTLAGTTLLFREKERQAIAQQREIRTAAADMGRFELRLGAFDWDVEKWAPRPADTAALPLEVRFHTYDRLHELEPGPLVDELQVVRSQPSWDGGIRSEIIELKSAPTWVEVRGRGDGCTSSSWVLAQSIPGYSERAQLKSVSLTVPTCQATLANTVEVPAGPYVDFVEEDGGTTIAELPAYRIDTYETTREAFAPYAALSVQTGDTDRSWVVRDLPRLPVNFINFATSQRFCLFMGKQVQSHPQWTKASRGGLWLDAARTLKNSTPARLTVWGALDPRRCNVGRDGSEQQAPVGSFPDDKGPYGAFDLAGNMAEWSQTAGRTGLHAVMGGDWANWDGATVAFEPYRIDRVRASNPSVVYSAYSLRCALQ